MKLKWNEENVSLEEVRGWIQKATNSPHVTGPTEIYRSNDWGITAMFQGDQDYVCKIAFLPLFQTSPGIYTFLNSLESPHVPHTVKAENINGQTWLLFTPFEGKVDNKTYTINDIVKTARTLALLQNQAAQKDEHDIPVNSVEDVEAECLHFISEVQERYQNEYKQNSQLISKNMNVEQIELEWLAQDETYTYLKERIKEACRVLAQYPLPLSLYHLDLHIGNVATLDNGERLIFDWEEAVITIPFFSIHKLLQNAKKTNLDRDETGETGEYLRWTENESLVIQAYLQALNLPLSYEEAHKLLNISMSIVPIFYAAMSFQFIKQVGWENNAAGMLAEDILLAFHRLKQI
ncbi:phosphotransferase [Pontibacillus marinus]|uniref:Aminoglycoside phosphotransferase domain-containing protein n=1 Tax=Pontibacillus marinus BH030004 = DSM 16465 TaxID=1385511 RepID=A0A0A5GF83_9BACI|nr:phosphotransferase [Pontibacillus marinus]KGX91876.1 hypothetical protein N783_00400 [Pontibacillus marinus BH030004 = DSM 16465]